jgi:arylsulfatase A-like enzyme
MADDLDEWSMQDDPGIRQVTGLNGTAFEGAYVAYALCSPGMATYFRGQYPHDYDITSDKARLGEPRLRQLGREQPNVATWLDNAGYQTKYLGKNRQAYLRALALVVGVLASELVLLLADRTQQGS